MYTFYRHYRVAADTFRDCHSRASAEDGMHTTELAERDLRALLASGSVPDVVLVTPERGLVEQCTPQGVLERQVFAWMDDDQIDAWIHAPHVLAEVEAIDAEEDPVSEEYAAHGSVRLPAGAQLTRLHVSPWIAPVAEALRTRYGVPVSVVSGADIPPPKVERAPPAVAMGVLAPEDCERMWDAYCGQDYANGQRLVSTAGPAVLPPDELAELAEQLLVAFGQIYGLPVTRSVPVLVCYGEGDYFGEHCDAGEAKASTLDRTVSLTMMLAKPGEDFTGGDLIVNGKLMELRAGDVVGFTARTPHEVRPVETGHRLVLVALGEVAR